MGTKIRRQYVNRIRRHTPSLSDNWHLDAVVISIKRVRRLGTVSLIYNLHYFPRSHFKTADHRELRQAPNNLWREIVSLKAA